MLSMDGTGVKQGYVFATTIIGSTYFILNMLNTDLEARTWKDMFMIISFQMLSQLANKRCVLLLDTILNCITKES